MAGVLVDVASRDGGGYEVGAVAGEVEGLRAELRQEGTHLWHGSDVDELGESELVREVPGQCEPVERPGACRGREDRQVGESVKLAFGQALAPVEEPGQQPMTVLRRDIVVGVSKSPLRPADRLVG